MEMRQSVLNLMSKVRSRAFNFIEKELLKIGVRDLAPSQGDILFVVAVKAPVEMRQIAVLTGRDKSTLTPMVNKLIKNGYITRVTSKEDRRRALISLTPKGHKIAPSLFKIGSKLERAMHRNISESDAKRQLETLWKMFSNLE